MTSELTALIGASLPLARGSLLTVIGVAEAIDAQGADTIEKRKRRGIISTGTGKSEMDPLLASLFDDFENAQSSMSLGSVGNIKISTGNG